MRAMPILLTLLLLAGCDTPDPKERVTVRLDTCCAFTADSVFVAGLTPLLVLQGPSGELTAGDGSVEAEVRPKDCSQLWIWLVETSWDIEFPFWTRERGETLFALPLPGCGDFVLEVNWTEDSAAVVEG